MSTLQASHGMPLSYDEYFDRILGGWFGKCLGGAVGAPWECYKGWIELPIEHAVPKVMPPNDDLDLQVLWLSVVEQKGPWFREADLADAWLTGCWYPFNEYGVFRKNYRLGVPPPYTSQIDNDWWDTGMGCPIRSELWGYIAPGAPDIAAQFAKRDGWLDHTEQSVGAEMMFSAMAADAFFVSDIRRLLEKHIGYLPDGSVVRQLVEAAIGAFDARLSLSEARDRIILAGGNPEACDAQVNVPFTILGLLYGRGDLWETILACIRLGFDTDCTCATAAAFIGQILGYSGLPDRWKSAISDNYVMGIEYRRPELTMTALARDTARVGVLTARSLATGVCISGAPVVEPWPCGVSSQETRGLSVQYPDGLSVAPGETLRVRVRVSSESDGAGLQPVTLCCPDGWTSSPTRMAGMVAGISAGATSAVPPGTVDFVVSAPVCVKTWPRSFRFEVRTADAEGEGDRSEQLDFALLGASVWTLLGVFYDPYEPKHGQTLSIDQAAQTEKPLCSLCGWEGRDCRGRCMAHTWTSLSREYIENEGQPDVSSLSRRMTRVLGRSPVLYARTSIVPISDLVRYSGEQCIYLYREFAVSKPQEAVLMVGNTDGFRLYLNGELLAEQDEMCMWSPNNNPVHAQLKEGVNRLVVKLLRRTDAMKFSLMFRGPKGHQSDHIIDIEDVVPLIYEAMDETTKK